ncbi:glycerophosphodiester phosphodiesterase [Natronosalvus vescus]|uniref:glycerophosphodiester phosphodiesterase n=1 Tax=Natronosalvus vescus TaxID=2953881 RepID=UPI0020913CBA|nr:glycerophosphodiester phosphodiesterase [Natronosalvus vescus]
MTTPKPAVIAHRGFAGVYPENTLTAFRSSASQSETTMIELDVQPAACGTPVVFHDNRLEGTRDGQPITDGEGVLWETSLETLSKTRVLATEESVPTLEAVFDALPSSIGVNVELKNPGSSSIQPGVNLEEAARDDQRALWEPFVERVVADCDRFDGEVIFSSFCEGALAAARNVAHEYPAATLVWGDLEAGVEIARRYDCEAINLPRNAITGTGLAGQSYAGLGDDEPSIDVLEIAHGEGRLVNVWTIDTWVQFEQLRVAGVDGIIVDYPGLDAGGSDSSLDS